MAAPAALTARWASLRHALPEGQTLPEEVWRARHVGVVVLLWAHAIAIPVYALFRGYTLTHSLAEASVVPLTAAIAMYPAFGRRVRTALASLGLLTCSAVLVHLSGGLIEMHFHFFVMVAVVALYQDWVPFLAAVGYVFVHHGFMGAVAPESVYNHIAGQMDPWRWAMVHALFITGISIACLVTWRLNESILAERRRAEERLREESRIVETLHEVGKTLAADLDTERVVQAVTDAATELTSARFGAFFYNQVDEQGESYMLFTLSGAPREAFARFGLPRNTPVFAPTFAGEGVVRLDDVTADPRYGTMPPHHGMPKGHLPVRSYLAAPVRSRTGEVLGGLFFGHPEPGRFSEVDERIVVGIAAQAAMALDNARLYEAEREARAASEAAALRVEVLAEAGRILTSSLEVKDLLGQLAQLLSARVADWCVLRFTGEDGAVGGVTVAACGGREWMAVAAPGEQSVAPAAVGRALASGRAMLVGHEAAESLQGLLPDEAFQLAVGQADVRSAIVAPLVARGEGLADGLGVLVLGSSEGRRLGEDDVSYAEELARRVAVALENAHLYSRQRTVAETLQHSLLPERLPELPGIAAAARYLPGGPDVEIGGDWYDMIPLPDGRLGLAMGDVVGRGEHAASLMGQLRSAVRAYALDGKSPAELMEAVNTLLLDAGTDQMATMVFGLLDPESGDLRVVSAGHPPALLGAPDGTARYLDAPPGLPLGAAVSPRYSEYPARMEPGGTLVLYTDGLVEDRALPLDLGLSRLRQGVLEAAGDLDALCGHVVRQAMEGHTHQDDVAILAVRLLPLGDVLELRLPAQPAMLAPLRALLRRWLAGVGASEQERYELLLVTIELCTNAIRHAGGPADATFALRAEASDVVRITVRDNGRWREAAGRVGGRGLGIVEACVDEIQVLSSDDGTEVRVVRRIGAKAPVVA